MKLSGWTLLVLCAWAPGATLAWAKDADARNCAQNEDQDLSIRGCTMILSRGNAESPRNRVSAFYNRGIAYKSKGDYNRAIADWGQAIRLNPKYAHAYHNRGLAYLNKGDYDRAIAAYNQLIRLDRKDAFAYCIRGFAYYNNGDFDRAIADYNQAIRLDSKHVPVAYASRAEVRARKGDLERALADSETAIRLNPKSAEPHAYRAYIFGKMGQFDRAFAEIAEAFRLDEKNSDAVLYRGELHLLKGEAQSALADFEAALAKTPSSQFARAGRDASFVALASSRPKPQPAAQPQPQVAATAPVAPLAAPAVPAPLSLAENRVALIIANANYAGLTPLRTPPNDARAVAAALRGAGFQKVIVFNNLARDELVKALQDFQAEADRADWALIYFAGHGVAVGNRNYAVPADARLKTDRDVPDEAVGLDRLVERVRGAHKLSIVIFDTCRDNPFTKMQQTLALRSLNRGLVRYEPPHATVVFYSAQDGNGDNSPFAAALAKHLGEPHLEVNQLFRLVIDDVWNATVDPSKREGQQPFVYGSLPSAEDYYFTP